MRERLNQFFSFLPLNKRFSISKFYRKITSPLRILPDFLIIGAPRCGTTSLYQYLIQHPSIFPAYRKEIKYFIRIYSKTNSRNRIVDKKDLVLSQIYYNLRINDYKAYFTFLITKYFYKYILRRKFITGEASSIYMFHPNVPNRVFYMLPSIKLIILLRNPIDRVYSDYHFLKNYGNINRDKFPSFEEVIKKEEKKLRKKSKISNRLHNIILERGRYLPYIKNWLRYFPKEQILIIKSEDLFENPHKIINEVFKFLDLPMFQSNEYKKYNVGRYKMMEEETRKWLINYYKPNNYQLYKFLGRNFGWDK
ncbi:MAG: sulfotransferase domain-containing protein [Promethearchaeota archaeon]